MAGNGEIQMSEYEKLRERLVNDLSAQFPSLNITGEYPPKAMIGMVNKNKPHFHVTFDNPQKERWYQQWNAETRYYAENGAWCEFDGSGKYMGRADMSRPTGTGTYEKIEGYDILPELSSISALAKPQDNEMDLRISKIEDAMNRLIGMVESVIDKPKEEIKVDTITGEVLPQKKKAGRPKKNVSENGEIKK